MGSLPAPSARPSRNVRVTLPGELHERLRHLGVDLRLPLGQLLAEAVVLLLRHHDRATGLPEPTKPV